MQDNRDKLMQQLRVQLRYGCKNHWDAILQNNVSMRNRLQQIEMKFIKIELETKCITTTAVQNQQELIVPPLLQGMSQKGKNRFRKFPSLVYTMIISKRLHRCTTTYFPVRISGIKSRFWSVGNMPYVLMRTKLPPWHHRPLLALLAQI